MPRIICANHGVVKASNETHHADRTTPPLWAIVDAGAHRSLRVDSRQPSFTEVPHAADRACRRSRAHSRAATNRGATGRKGLLDRLARARGADSTTNKLVREPFLSRLKTHGWSEGQDFVMEYRSAPSVERLAPLAAELVQARVDVIVAANHSAIDAAVQTTRSVPIVRGFDSDPVAMGWVKSLARPGGNITGMASIVTPEMAGKRLEILRDALPRLARVGVLWWPDVKDPATLWQTLQEPSRRVQIALVSLPVHNAEETERAFVTANRDRAEGMMVQGDIFLFQYRQKIVDLAAIHRIPASFAWATYVQPGGLMSYGPNVPQVFTRAADYVDRILKGAQPGDLPVEQPTKFDLVINLKTAKALGLTIPQSLLVRADEIIQC